MYKDNKVQKEQYLILQSILDWFHQQILVIAHTYNLTESFLINLQNWEQIQPLT
jgi:hypothetical protein